MQDTFQWTDELVQEFVQFTLHQSPAFQGRYTDMEQFKSSKSPKKEWEIVAFLEESSATLWKLREDGLYRCDRFLDQPGYPLQSFLDDRDPIHSVRRLSDSLTFSCQEKVKTPYAGDLVIHSFEIRGQEMIARFTNGHPSNGYCNINGLSKLPQPILTTVDGVEIFEGMEFWVVDREITRVLSFSQTARENDRGKWQSAKIFSTKEAAESFVVDYAVAISLNDVKEAWNKGRSFVGTDWLLEQLTILVKQKLNQ